MGHIHVTAQLADFTGRWTGFSIQCEFDAVLMDGRSVTPPPRYVLVAAALDWYECWRLSRISLGGPAVPLEGQSMASSN